MLALWGFFVVMSLALANLMIGVAIGEISEIKSVAKNTMLKNKVGLIAYYQATLPQFILRVGFFIWNFLTMV